MTALSLYLGCLVFGGIFIAASLLGGDHDHSSGGGGTDHGGHGGGDHDHGDGHAHGHGHGGLVLIFSLRFWSFALAFFGLTGVLLAWTGALTGALAFIVASAVGLAAGYGASRAIGALAARPVGIVASSASHVGREGRLLLPVSRGQRGKVRVEIDGADTDLLADTDAGESLEPGAQVLIVGMRGAVAVVERTPAALSPAAKEI